ncbi:signal recognition particle receptor subunit alpha, partial [uncultured Duncaniella sp.]
MGLFDLFSRKKEKKETLDKGLEKTQRGLFDRISHAIAGKSTVDDDVLDNLEEVFVTSDVGVDTTLRIIDRLQARVAKDKYVGASELNRLLCEEISEMLAENGETSSLDDFSLPEGNRPHVIMVVGVNGVGKTTTIGKMAAQFKRAGNKVVLGAADTFRAAAIEQL